MTVGRPTTLFLAAIVATAGCEAVPTVRFDVRESTEATPATFEPGPIVQDEAALGGAPIRGAIVLFPVGREPDDLAGLAARLDHDSTVTARMHPHIDFKGDDVFAMRTGSAGTAEYSELLLFGLGRPKAVTRTFYVWAEGFVPRTVAVEFGAEGGRIDVPLVRSKR